MIDSFDIYKDIPSHRERLAAEKKINVYYVPGTGREGEAMFTYAVCSALLHERFMQEVKSGHIPDFAVVVAVGQGEPDAQTQEKIRHYYGIDPFSQAA